MGHFWVTFGLFFKASPGAHPFVWKLVFICIWMKANFHVKRWAPGLALKKRPKVILKWHIHPSIVCFCSKSYLIDFEVIHSVSKQTSFSWKQFLKPWPFLPCLLMRWLVIYHHFFPDADKQYLLSMKHREERTWVQAYLDQEKHVLRQMQGGFSVGMMQLETMRLISYALGINVERASVVDRVGSTIHWLTS